MDLFDALGLGAGSRQPEENVLYIAIYSDEVPQPCPSVSNDSTAAALEAVAARCSAWLLPHVSGYVWHKDALVLHASSTRAPPWAAAALRASAGRRKQQAAEAAAKAAAGSAVDAPPGATPAAAAAAGAAASPAALPCVWCCLRFGDYIEDEWWAVWLMLALTREQQDLAVQVWDNDGQFLLIEAAYALPRWLKPETAANRVWLRRGGLHVVPLPSAAAPGLPAHPSVQQALGVLREGRYATASPRVQRPIEARLEGYPRRARVQQQHVARCLLPLPLAAALRAEPQLVAALVEAFYYRDVDDMRAAARMRHLPPTLEQAPVLLTMTRCHYAQLAQQRFSAPRGWPMPPPDAPLAKAADLGLKLVAGAEVLCTRAAQRRARAAAAAGAAPQAPAPGAEAAQAAAAGDVDGAAAGAGAAAAAALSEADVASEPGWCAFKAALESSGYFRGNIPGAAMYRQLLQAALASYASAERLRRGDPSCEPPTRLLQLVEGAAARQLQPHDFKDPAGRQEDDDSWMEAQAEQLQQELQRRQAEMAEAEAKGSRRGAAGQAGQQQQQPGAAPVAEVDADAIASKLRAFVEHLSGLEGAEVPQDIAELLGGAGGGSRATRGSADADAGAGGAGQGGADPRVMLDPEGFVEKLTSILGLDPKGLGGKAGKRQAGRAVAGQSGRGGDAESAGEGEDDDDDYEDGESSSEGSSFFSDEEDEEESEEDEGEGEGEVLGARQRAEHLRRSSGRDAGVPGVAASGAPPKGGSSSGGAPMCAPQATAAGQGAAAQLERQQPAASAPPLLRKGFLASRPLGDGSSSSTNTAAAPATASSSSSIAAPATALASAARPLVPDVADPPLHGQAVGGRDIGGLSGYKARRWEEVATSTDSDDEDGTDVGTSGSSSSSGGEEDDEGEEGVGLDELGISGDGDEHRDLLALQRLILRGQGGEEEERGAGAPSSSLRSGPAASSGRQQPLDGVRRVARRAAAAPPASGGRRGHGNRDGDGGEGQEDEEETFMDAYDAALQAELASTTMAQSFERIAAPAAGGGGAAAAAAPGAGGGGEAGDSGPLRPIDLDMNLVKNLLKSYTAQQGVAGPAGNLAGLLGLSLKAGDPVD